jgi:hypothetical protein
MSDMCYHNREPRPFDEQSSVSSEWSVEVVVAAPAPDPVVPTEEGEEKPHVPAVAQFHLQRFKQEQYQSAPSSPLSFSP